MGCTSSSSYDPRRTAIHADTTGEYTKPTSQPPLKIVELGDIVISEEEEKYLQIDNERREREGDYSALPLAQALRGAHQEYGTHPVLPISWYCVCRPGSEEDGSTKENQDAFVVHEKIGEDERSFSLGVYDGHGPNGSFASNFLTNELIKHLKQYELDKVLAHAELSVGRILHNACLQCNHDLSLSGVDVYLSGTTGIVGVIKADHLYVANVGDSRAVLSRANHAFPTGHEALPLSSDHKPDTPEEEQRIIDAGGRVFSWGVPRVWRKDADIPGLAMSRSFGDQAAESVGVYAQPDITVTRLDAGDEFLIFASDGVWEFINSQEAVDIVARHLHKPPSIFAKQACHELVQESIERWQQNETSVDDCTCCIVRLNEPTPNAHIISTTV